MKPKTPARKARPVASKRKPAPPKRRATGKATAKARQGSQDRKKATPRAGKDSVKTRGRKRAPAAAVGAAAAGPVPGWPQWEEHFALIPFEGGAAHDEFNDYRGLYDNTVRVFAAVGDGPPAVSYATKFGIDGDGSGGEQPGDEDYRPNTALHYHDAATWGAATPLNSLTYSFAVLPGESETLPNFTELGLRLGDLGIAFFGRGLAAPFIIGDVGPTRKVGEGSTKMAKLLGMDWPPFMNSGAATGGFNQGEMEQFAPGVVHIAFPGSRDRTDKMTDLLTQAQLAEAAWALFDRWIASLEE